MTLRGVTLTAAAAAAVVIGIAILLAQSLSERELPGVEPREPEPAPERTREKPEKGSGPFSVVEKGPDPFSAPPPTAPPTAQPPPPPAGRLVLRGRVGEHVLPLPGAVVALRAGEAVIASTISDEQGRFELSATAPGLETLRWPCAETDAACVKGADPFEVRVQPGEGPAPRREPLLSVIRRSKQLAPEPLTLEVHFMLHSGGWLAGTVRDDEGRPVAGASVIGERTGERPFSTTTDARGTYVFAPGTRGDSRWRVHVEAPRRMPTAPRDVALPARGESRLDFVIRSGFAIAGQVHGVDGRPAAGALVFATREVEPKLSGQARTDADGRYRIEGLSAAKYSVRVAEGPTEGPDRERWMLTGPLPADPERAVVAAPADRVDFTVRYVVARVRVFADGAAERPEYLVEVEGTKTVFFPTRLSDPEVLLRLVPDAPLTLRITVPGRAPWTWTATPSGGSVQLLLDAR